MDDKRPLRRAADLAIGYLEGVRDRPVAEQASIDELRAALRVPLNDAPLSALRMLGFGTARRDVVPSDEQGRMRVGELERMLSAGGGPAIVIAQVGDVNS